MGVHTLVPTLLFRVVLPLSLLAAAIFRYNAFSFVYLCLLLLTPLLKVPSQASMSGATGKFLPLVNFSSILPIVGHIVFQVFLVSIATDEEPYGYVFSNCSSNERLLRQIGFQSIDNASASTIVRLIGPDVLVFLVSILVLVLSKRSVRLQTNVQEETISGSARYVTNDNGYLTFTLAFLQSLTLIIAGLMVPSVFNAIYFLVFLVILMLWGCYRSMGKAFGYVRLVLLFYTGVHLLLLHLYQFQFFQDALDPSDFLARLLGLTGLVLTDCDNATEIQFHSNIPWYEFVNPATILLLYWILAFNTNLWRRRKSKLLDQKAFDKVSIGSNEDQVVANIDPQANETGSMVFSGSSYGLSREEDKGDNEETRLHADSETAYTDKDRLVEAEQPPGGQYGGLQDEPRLSAEPETSGSKPKKSQPPTKRSIWMSFLVVVIKQSYVLSLVAMMAWSIAFLSWLTFALLLMACLLWMMPNSRKWCLRISPFILFYVIGILMALYAFNMNIQKELPIYAGNYKLNEIGMERYDNPCIPMGVQVFFTFLIVLSVRQFSREKREEAADGQHIMMKEKGKKTSFLHRLLPTSDMHQYDSNTTMFIGSFLWVVLCKYWIFFCTIMLAVISLTDVVIYRIIYMILCALFVLTFQVSYTLWRKLMYVFWWVVILYSMLVLIVIYTYQFQDFPGYWRNGTGFDDDTLKDIGLETYDTAGLFVKLLTPTMFVIIIIIQVRYFHEHFLRLSALDRFKDMSGEIATTDEEGNPNNITEDESDDCIKAKSKRSKLKNVVLKCAEWWHTFTTLLWRVAEVHFFKVVIITVAIVSVNEVSALTFVYFLLLAIFLPCYRNHVILSHLLQLWTMIIILAKMIFQLKLMETAYWTTTCDIAGNSTNASIPSNITEEEDNAKWFGLQKSDEHSIAYLERLFITLMVIVAFESIIRYHQQQHFNHPHHQRPARGIIFINVTRNMADETVRKCAMYFANYAFYKFGLEICFIMTTITLCVRVDAVSIIYIILIGILMSVKRGTVAKLWPVYTLFLIIMLPVQSLILIGFPPGACIEEYPWESTLPNNLNLWLFLPSFTQPPGSTKLIVDVLQLLFVCLQSFVFYLEAHPDKMRDYGGGDNHGILEEVETNAPNPYSDFTIKQKTPMDLIKAFVFEFMYWVTMLIIFVTGVTRINIFSLFYVVAVFYFMWYGAELFLKPLRNLLRMWNKLIVLCMIVLVMKAALQLIGCVFATDLIHYGMCWLIQLFGINCVLANASSLPSHKDDCRVDDTDAGLAWDVICFAFLLLQRRIYLSHYFRHVMDTLKARHNLASRGAEIINRILIREVNRQREQEALIMANIKKQMEAIKGRQATLRKDYKEPEEHFQAIRAGDYYLLEDAELKDDDEQNQPTTLTFGKLKPEEEDDTEKGMNPLEVIHTAQDQGAGAAIEIYAQQNEEENEDEEEETETESGGNKIKTIALLLYTLWLSFIDWLIRSCNNISRNYRLVGKKLASELIVEKQKLAQARKHSPGKSKSKAIEEQEAAPTDSAHVKVDMTALSFEDDADQIQSHAAISTSLEELEKLDATLMEIEVAQKSRFFRLMKATSMLVASHLQLLCYFLMILDQMVYSSLLTLPLPLMVFLWGMLSVPRPSKTFWITAITYTEAIVVVKYLFQFGFFPWNDNTIHDSPYYPPRFIGIEEQSGYANVEIALLLALFMHRSLLRRYGLWKDADDISADLMAAKMKEGSAVLLVDPSVPTFEGENAGDAVDAVAKEDSDETQPGRSKLKVSMDYIKSPFVSFFHQLTQSGYNASVDVYAPMFACDFILFIVLVLGFSSFGPADTAGGGDVTSYIRDNKIPAAFLVMILTQFIFIIIDRALFLRKLVLGKLIYQILMVIVLHIWLFFVLPSTTKRSFYDNTAAQIWYFIKCIYFGLSAKQIRCGYPARILGNYLTKSYGYVSLISFKIFMVIPFLLELRTLMDWIWTDSTLAIGSWLQLEDIYANIYVLKCYREIEKKYPTERAQKKGLVVKYLVGGLLLIIIIFIIWFPLVFFSLFNSVFIPNPPIKAMITIDIGGYQPLFTTNAIDPEKSLRKLTGAEYDRLKDNYKKDRGATAFLSGFEPEDVTLISFEGASLDIWGISPVSRIALAKDLRNTTAKNPLQLTMSVNFIRSYLKGQSESSQGATFYVNLRSKEYKKASEKLAEVINGSSTESVDIRSLFPQFLHLSGSQEVTDVQQLMSGRNGKRLSNISIGLKTDNASALSNWWDVQEILDGTTFFKTTTDVIRSNEIIFVTFNDRRVPDSLSFLSGYGIVGLYISFILLIGRLLRVNVSGQHTTIIFRELPDVNKVLRLLLDLYLVREMKEFHLEEDLYASVIFLYRSPENMISYTRQTVRIGNLKKKTD